MEHFRGISDHLYYKCGTSVATISDQRVIVGVAAMISDKKPVPVYNDASNETFVDRVFDIEDGEERRLMLFAHTLRYFVRPEAEPLDQEQQAIYKGLYSIIADHPDVIALDEK
jgi:hypothetical protein